MDTGVYWNAEAPPAKRSRIRHGVPASAGKSKQILLPANNLWLVFTQFDRSITGILLTVGKLFSPDLIRGPYLRLRASASPAQRMHDFARIVKFGLPLTDVPGHEYLADRDVASLSLWPADNATSIQEKTMKLLLPSFPLIFTCHVLVSDAAAQQQTLSINPERCCNQSG